MKINQNIKPDIFKIKNIKDNRGSFLKILSDKIYNKTLKKNHIVEINISKNKKKGTIRGFHYQIGKFKEKKFVYCLQGSLLDIAIDINKKSKSYLKVYKKNLNENDNKLFYIPEDHAHGYQTLSNDTTLLYFHSKPYKKRYQKTINPLKNNLKIKWPLPVTNISISDKNSK